MVQRMFRFRARKGKKVKNKKRLQRYNWGTPFEKVTLDISGPLSRTSTENRTS